MYVPLHKINFQESCKDGERQEQNISCMKRSTSSTKKNQSKTGDEERKKKVGDVKVVGDLSVGVRVVIFPEKDTRKNKDKVQRGVIRYLGYFEKYDRYILAGVEMVCILFLYFFLYLLMLYSVKINIFRKFI